MKHILIMKILLEINYVKIKNNESKNTHSKTVL